MKLGSAHDVLHRSGCQFALRGVLVCHIAFSWSCGVLRVGEGFQGWAEFCASAIRDPDSLVDGFACWIDKHSGVMKVKLERLGLDDDAGFGKGCRIPLDHDNFGRLVAEARNGKFGKKHKCMAQT